MSYFYFRTDDSIGDDEIQAKTVGDAIQYYLQVHDVRKGHPVTINDHIDVILKLSA